MQVMNGWLADAFVNLYCCKSHGPQQQRNVFAALALSWFSIVFLIGWRHFGVILFVWFRRCRYCRDLRYLANESRAVNALTLCYIDNGIVLQNRRQNYSVFNDMLGERRLDDICKRIWHFSCLVFGRLLQFLIFVRSFAGHLRWIVAWNLDQTCCFLISRSRT